VIATVYKSITFDAAHHLPKYKGACSRLHGHTYTLQAGLTGHIQERTGMVVDMKDLGDALKAIVEKWDHRDLNEFFFMPTAEAIASSILIDLKFTFSTYQVTVRLWETPTSWVEILS